MPAWPPPPVPGAPSRSSAESFTLDAALAEQARRLGINISAAARHGVADAVRAALAHSDRAAYERRPEDPESFWREVETWGAE